MNHIFGMERLVNNIVNKSENTTASKKTEQFKQTKGAIGNPKLSETAASYYENLKAKYGDVEFVLVDDEQSGTAKEQLANYQSKKSLTVFISESEVEEMAVNETTRTQNEGLIDSAITKMPDMIEQLKEAGANVKSFGMEIDDNGSVSYFAVVDQNIQAQKERIEQTRAEKKEAEKLEKKKEEKKEHSEMLQGNENTTDTVPKFFISDTTSKTKQNGIFQLSKTGNKIQFENKISNQKENLTTITASTLDDLFVKLQDFVYATKGNQIRTQQELMVGQNFDFKL